MSNITVCKVLNKSNESKAEELEICSEWTDSKVKVIIIRIDNTMLTGEVLITDFSTYAKTYDKTLEVYLEETKDILSGKNDDIEFLLKDKKFFWKRKKWLLGQIIVEPVTAVEYLSSFTRILINNYSKVEKDASELAKDNQNLKSTQSKLSIKLDEMIILKEQLETALYKRFVLLLNTKKAKIRELKSKLEKFECNKDSVFDASTDESDNESDLKKNLTSHSNSIIKSTTLANKRLLEDDSYIKEGKRKKSEIVEANNTKHADIIEKKRKKSEIIEGNDTTNITEEKGKQFEIIEANDTKHDITNIIEGKRKKSEIIEGNDTKQDDKTNIKEGKRKSEIIEANGTKQDDTINNMKDKMKNSETEIIPTASTSKELNFFNIGEDEETPDLLSDESECEVELQLEEEKVEDKDKIKACAIIEEDSEEEMF